MVTTPPTRHPLRGTHRWQATGRGAKALVVAVLATAMVAAITFAGTVRTAVELAATYAVRGTGVNGFGGIFAESDEMIIGLAQRYVGTEPGSPLPPPPAPIIAVQYPASIFDPPYDGSRAQGLAELQRLIASNGDADPVIFGYSQGANVGTNYKRIFNAQYAGAPAESTPNPTWVFIGNVNRPNGGLFARFPGLRAPIVDATFDGASPTHTAGAAPGEITTVDISAQYDFFSDFPTYPLNLLAVLNAAFGIFAVHANYGDIGLFSLPGRIANGGFLDPGQALLQDTYGDTAYYLLPARRLPLLAPLQLLGVPDPLLAVIDAPLRVLVEAGYDRTASPGVPTTARWVPQVDPRTLLTDFLTAIPTGIDDGLQGAGLGRPLDTTPAGPYGVGGPPVDMQESAPAPAAGGSDEEAVEPKTAVEQHISRSSAQEPALDPPNSEPFRSGPAPARRSPAITPEADADDGSSVTSSSLPRQPRSEREPSVATDAQDADAPADTREVSPAA